MGTRKAVEKGPTTRRVAANVKALRVERGLSLDELSERLAILGRPIIKTGLSKLERGERGADVDDLMALSLALLVTPNRLLLEPDADGTMLQISDNPTLLFSARQTWAWSCGEAAWGDRSGHPSTLFDGIALYDFQTINRPHDVPVRLTVDQWRELEPWQKRLDELRDEMTEAGADFRALVPDQVTYEDHSEEHSHG